MRKDRADEMACSAADADAVAGGRPCPFCASGYTLLIGAFILGVHFYQIVHYCVGCRVSIQIDYELGGVEGPRALRPLSFIHWRIPYAQDQEGHP